MIFILGEGGLVVLSAIAKARHVDIQSTDDLLKRYPLKPADPGCFGDVATGHFQHLMGVHAGKFVHGFALGVLRQNTTNRRTKMISSRTLPGHSALAR